jgi:hypothetical protein
MSVLQYVASGELGRRVRPETRPSSSLYAPTPRLTLCACCLRTSSTTGWSSGARPVRTDCSRRTARPAWPRCLFARSPRRGRTGQGGVVRQRIAKACRTRRSPCQDLASNLGTAKLANTDTPNCRAHSFYVHAAVRPRLVASPSSPQPVTFYDSLFVRQARGARPQQQLDGGRVGGVVVQLFVCSHVWCKASALARMHGCNAHAVSI